jgi:tetratricopeptide (TPR) repeat protein
MTRLPELLLLGSVLLAALRPSPVRACGPYFDNPRLSWVGREMLGAPRSSFDDDVRVLANLASVPEGVTARRVRTVEGDAQDLEAAMGSAERVPAYLAAREAIQPAPSGVPEEFRLYQEGVIELRAGRIEAAQERFEALLELPPERRHYRSTWAAYMLPHTRDDDALAAEDYARVRELAAQGYGDSLGLALASLRLQAAHLDAAPALEGCLIYRAAGGTAACGDLHVLTERALEHEDLGPALERPLVAEAVASLLTSHPRSMDEQALRWLEAAERRSESVAGADRLAWAAYQRGQFEAAGRWAERAGEQPMARWMQAKLALREGDVEAAAEHLRATTELFPGPRSELFADYPANTSCPHHSSHPVRAAQIELGILLVALDRPVEALQAFLLGGDWLDAAWVAERLLSTEELVEFVDRWFPGRPQLFLPEDQGPVHDLLDGQDLPQARIPASMRHLLARRLAREGRWSEALPYFSGEQSWDAERVSSSLARGQDLSLGDDARGTAKWEAAFLMKQEGWELLATELEPDFRVLRGWYQGADTRTRRSSDLEEDRWLSEDELLARRLLRPSPAELARLEASSATTSCGRRTSSPGRR